MFKRIMGSLDPFRLASSWGSLLELSFNGKNPIKLKDGSVRTFLENGDNVIMRGYCQDKGIRIGFGCVEGVVLPADPL